MATPLKVAMPDASGDVMVGEELLEKVVWAEPETMLRVTESEELLAVLPKASLAVAVTENPTPAVWGEGTVAMARLATVDEAFTVKLPDVPVIPWVAVRVVDWASVRVMLAVPTPLAKVTEPG